MYVHLFCGSLLAAVALLGLGETPALAHPGIHEQEQHAKAALEQGPEDPNRHITMGRVQVEKGEWDAALAAYAEARRFGAEHDKVSILEGVAYLKAGWPHMGRARFESILHEHPDHAEARLGRARAWMKLAQPSHAVDDYKVAIAAVEPLRPGHLLEYRDALTAIGRDSDAVVALDLGVEKLGQVPALQLAAIDLNIRAKQYDEALQRLDQLLAASPGHPLWITQRADILEEAGRKEEARLAYAEALSQLQSRNARGRSRRLKELEGRVRAVLDRPNSSQEVAP